MSNLLSVSVHAANIHDTTFGIVPATGAYGNYPTIKKFCGDGGYRKTFEEEVFEELGLGVDISERISPGFAVIPKRWSCQELCVNVSRINCANARGKGFAI